jgi:hypothetical protein
MITVIYNKHKVTEKIAQTTTVQKYLKDCDEAIEHFEKSLKDAGVDLVVRSSLYSVQYDHLKDIPDHTLVILHNVGVRYDSARETIAEKKLKVYREDTVEKLWKAIADPASATLADLNEA